MLESFLLIKDTINPLLDRREKLVEVWRQYDAELQKPLLTPDRIICLRTQKAIFDEAINAIDKAVKALSI